MYNLFRNNVLLFPIFHEYIISDMLNLFLCTLFFACIYVKNKINIHYVIDFYFIISICYINIWFKVRISYVSNNYLIF